MKPNNIRQQEKQDEKPYEIPAIIYSGTITTRAGSPVGEGDSKDGIDPADLFSD